MQKRNIILIGFMATGKTVVGQRLARSLHMKYVSTDTLVEKASGKKISSIFSEKGEPYFRSLETKALRSLKGKRGLVIACGGGIVIKAANRSIIKKLGKVFLLSATPATVDKRLKKLSQRPILDIADKKNRIKKIRSMLRSRSILYRRSADTVIRTDNKTVKSVVKEIKGRYLSSALNI